MRKRLIAIVLGSIVTMCAYSQNFAVKSNLLYDATLTINAGAEIGLASKWTLDVSGNYNGWSLSHQRRWKHWMVQPEARYWFCDRFAGHFIGAHLLGGEFNVGSLPLDFKFMGKDLSPIQNHRYQGWFIGAGIAYGYDWILSRHWNLELEAGVGYIYAERERFQCENCGKKEYEGKPTHYVGPTKAAINLVYTF